VSLSRGSDSFSVPNWWRPWIHDLALMVGSVMHGFLYLENIRKDKGLPFTEVAIMNHVRALYADPDERPFKFPSPQHLADYIERAPQMIPEPKILEER
jgi:hypothetical protein